MTQRNRYSVLIVDDNLQNLQYLGNLLENNGYEVTVVKSGERALEYLSGEDTDLILLDIMMPGMDGYQVCEKLKANKKTRHIPVIFITAKTEEEDIVKAFETGGVDYVTKPYKAAELLARVKTHVEMKILKGLIPICSSCKKVRSDDNYWEQIEVYIEKHSDSHFSHGICPDCTRKLYGKQPWFRKMTGKEGGKREDS